MEVEIEAEAATVTDVAAEAMKEAMADRRS
jgi:hypothetical protein